VRLVEAREGLHQPVTYIATVVLEVRPSKRPEVLSAIRQVMRCMRMTPGCVACHSLVEADDARTLMIVSEWGSEEALEELLRSEEFLVLRGMRMLLQKSAQLVVDEVAARTVLALDD
jgi:quinol monooxygenase YgiN